MKQTPDLIFQELFSDLHLSGLWSDGKLLSDAIPKKDPAIILEQYRAKKDKSDFDLTSFFNENFTISQANNTHFKSDTSRPIKDHIELLWEVLQRKADEEVAGSSLLPLPYPYIVPGGRFNEIFYWDSYFVMLGLQVSGHIDSIENMINNFSWLIDTVGFIPNGNRSYFLGRSQPPFYALMIQLLASEKGEEVYLKYLPQLEKEYAFWMLGKSQLNSVDKAVEHAVAINGGVLNRYYDRFHHPRAEMYAADLEVVEEAPNRNKEKLFLDIRAACESGWDFSARWMDDPHDLSTIRASDILPVDLNCLLFSLEDTLATAYAIKGDRAKTEQFIDLSQRRKNLILNVFWSQKDSFFMDYDFVKEQHTSIISLAAAFPLYLNIATKEQAKHCAAIIEKELLRPGGLVSTPIHSGQQWDAPNGWPPLQWTTIKGLRNYGYDELANTIKNNWVNLCQSVYQRTGKMMEKYNVEDLSLLSGGGEYPVQDGFGWTNGVLLKLLSEGE